MHRRLVRSSDRIIGGVCGGIAEYFGLEKTLLRIVYLMLFLFGGVGILVYIIFWILMPDH